MPFASDPVRTVEPARNAHARRRHPRNIDTVSYCPDHDPILTVGLLQCPQCKAVTFPTDAEWMDRTHILATFPRSCGHVTGGNFLLDVTTRPPRPPLADPGRYDVGVLEWTFVYPGYLYRLALGPLDGDAEAYRQRLAEAAGALTSRTTEDVAP